MERIIIIRIISFQGVILGDLSLNTLLDALDAEDRFSSEIFLLFVA